MASPPSPASTSHGPVSADSSSRSGYTRAGTVSAEEMRLAEQALADAKPTTSSCMFCDWTHEGTALECREEAKAHREREHPEACIRRPRRRRMTRKRELRTASEQEQIRIDTQEARRVRHEREQAEMLAKVERGRERDRAALAALDGAA